MYEKVVVKTFFHSIGKDGVNWLRFPTVYGKREVRTAAEELAPYYSSNYLNDERPNSLLPAAATRGLLSRRVAYSAKPVAYCCGRHTRSINSDA